MRIADRFRDDDFRGEMRDGVDFMLLDEARDQFGVAEIADHEFRRFRNRPGEARRQIVENDHLLARVEKTQNHVAADIAGAACDQNRHFRLAMPRGSRHFNKIASINESWPLAGASCEIHFDRLNGWTRARHCLF